jgi:predicted signal transduction protein with EAL and GGDEF domain
VGAGTHADGEIHAKRLAEQVEKPFEFEGHTLDPKVSIGMAIYPEDGDEIAKLIDHADFDLFEVKRARKQPAKGEAKDTEPVSPLALPRRMPLRQRASMTAPQRALGTYR